jgi:hypothetical protein
VSRRITAEVSPSVAAIGSAAPGAALSGREPQLDDRRHRARLDQLRSAALDLGGQDSRRVVDSLENAERAQDGAESIGSRGVLHTQGIPVRGLHAGEPRQVVKRVAHRGSRPPCAARRAATGGRPNVTYQPRSTIAPA